MRGIGHGTEELGRGESAPRRGRARVGEILVAGLLGAVVVMMIVPLAQPLLDLLISVNFAVSLLVLAMALFLRRPLRFSAFPTLLLVATLYRLALNVASTRLILTEADAGRIIGAFGGFVVGDDILVGAVIFGIIALVMFLVITKGAERVAEVAARFTLDSLPGRQVAIEADLRAGAVTPGEVARQRERLQSVSHYYGSLDGAMKFVRGDAIAGLVIVVVNIAGGIAVGVLRGGMSVGQALDTYGRLTVGDGLIAMFPSLLISTAAGLLVMRVGAGEDGDGVGAQLGRQLGDEPRTLLLSAGLVTLLAALPGLPVWPFAVLGGVLAAAGAALLVRAGRGQGSGTTRDAASGRLGLDDVQGLLDELSERKPVLVRETVPKKISLATLTDLLLLLEEDGLDRGLLPELLEAVARDEGGGRPWQMMERLRKRMGPSIWRELPISEPVEAAVLHDETEELLDESLVETDTGRLLHLPVDMREALIDECAQAFSGMEDPVLLVKPRLRKPLGALLAEPHPMARVIAMGEPPQGVSFKVVARVTAA